MRTWIGLAAVAAIGVASPGFAQPQVTPEVQRQLDELMSSYTQDLGKKDAAAAASHYTADAVVLSPTTPTMVIKDGREQIQKYLQYMLDKDYHIEGKTLRISPLGDDAAMLFGEYRTSGTNSQGHAFNVTGVWSAVDVREGDGWKIRLLTAFPQPRE